MSEKKLTIISFAILILTTTAILIFSKLTDNVSTMLGLLKENKGQSATLSSGLEKKAPLPETLKMPKNPELKAYFWEINPQTFEKKKYIGCACIEKGKIYINVKHPNLKTILKNPYTPAETSAKYADISTPYKPGTQVHLKAIAQEAWRWGYVSEIQGNKKQ